MPSCDVFSHIIFSALKVSRNESLLATGGEQGISGVLVKQTYNVQAHGIFMIMQSLYSVVCNVIVFGCMFSYCILLFVMLLY